MTIENIFYIFYSLIQGITEFIPISSSGHLNLMEIIFNKASKRNFLYETSAHFSSLLALLLYLYRNKHFEYGNLKLHFLPIAIATIPALLIGALMLILEINIISLNVIGTTFILGGVMLYFADKKKFQLIVINNKYHRFIFAGLFQCLAFLPGFSRSGSCIIAFRLLGDERKISSIYSLYLGVPLILISFVSNIKNLDKINFDFNLLIILFTTFISAYITLSLFIKFINKISFTPFVIYRIIVGILILTIF